MSLKTAVKKIRTKLGFVAGIVLILLSAESVPVNYFLIGVALIFFGESIRLWSAGHLRKTKEVICSGPYKFTRNPLYIGSFFILTGFLIIIQSWIIAAVIYPLYIIIYQFTIRKEERFLAEKFGEDFKSYMHQVPRIIPGFSKPDCADDKPFDLQLMIKNKEYQTILGELALLLIFWFGLGYQARIFLIDLVQNIFRN